MEISAGYRLLGVVGGVYHFILRTFVGFLESSSKLHPIEALAI
jgi:hypothetical protein